jgi:hypothetical protein
LSTGSKNGTLKRKATTPTSPTPSNTDSQLDFLLKSLAKEAFSGIQRDEARNEINRDSKDEETKALPAEIPNNIAKYSNTAKPLPPGQIKCNILKAKLEEELGASVVTKLTNQMFVAAANNDEANLNSLNAATFVSVQVDEDKLSPTTVTPSLSKLSPWLVSQEVVSSPVSKVNTTETTIIRKSVITTQL